MIPSTLNVYAPIGELGYGVYSRGILKGLMNNGVFNFHLSPIGQVQLSDAQEVQALAYNVNFVGWNREAPSVCIWHEHDLNKFSGKKLLAYPIFEVTKFNPLAINYLKQMDVVLVASQWAKRVVEENIGNSTRIEVVRGGAEILSSPQLDTIPKNQQAFTFLSVGKLEKRKAQREAIRAYGQAFADKQADTRFIVHCYNPFIPNFEQLVTSMLQSEGYRVVTQTTVTGSIIGQRGNAIVEVPKTHISKLQLSQLYRYSHVGVFPSRGEGWNLPLLEAIMSNVPCIASNYSAHTEYLTKEFNYPESLLLNKLTQVVANDNLWFKGDRGDWADPSVEEISEKMLWAHKNYSELFTEFDTSEIKKSLTWENTGKRLIEVVEP